MMTLTDVQYLAASRRIWGSQQECELPPTLFQTGAPQETSWRRIATAKRRPVLMDSWRDRSSWAGAFPCSRAYKMMPIPLPAGACQMLSAYNSIGTLIYSHEKTLFRIEKMLIERRVQRTPQLRRDRAISIDQFPKLSNDMFYHVNRSECFRSLRGHHRLSPLERSAHFVSSPDLNGVPQQALADEERWPSRRVLSANCFDSRASRRRSVPEISQKQCAFAQAIWPRL
ncbi:hypothetical protein ACE103_10000 [Bradyrhizobium sp. ma5]|uniref:hypothetical protein n=1 Tax=Bradyrhizobium sp. ma5 TaxID=3344828 RepID=UPI0035D4ECB6